MLPTGSSFTMKQTTQFQQILSQSRSIWNLENFCRVLCPLGPLLGEWRGGGLRTPLTPPSVVSACFTCPLQALFCQTFKFRGLNYSPDNEMCVRSRRLSAICLLSKMRASIFQIIYIWNKTLHPCVNRGLKQRHKVQTCLQGLSTFWH